MSYFYESLVRPALFSLDPEQVHHLTLRACERMGESAWLRRRLRARYVRYDPRLSQTIAGISFSNPLGLAAGFDKNGHAVNLMSELGFSHVEVGSVSAYPSKGNPPPRLFRLPEDEAVVVNYGVPNEGADAVAERLESKSCAVPLGLNLVKTNDEARPGTDNEVMTDYSAAFLRLESRASYINLNMSCPNSANDRNYFDDIPKVNLLLERLARHSPKVPVFLKLKPTMDRGVLAEIVAIADQYPFVAGFGINLASGKPAALRLHTPVSELSRLPGAVSGRPVEEMINANLRLLFEAIGPESRYKLMAAGGVFSAVDAYRKIRLGASLVQMYTALIYRGPSVVREILSGLSDLLVADGFANVADAVGVDVLDRANGRGAAA